MKNAGKFAVGAIAVCMVLSMSVLLSGCFMDQWLLEPLKTPSGEVVYRDVAASKASGIDVLVPASERIPDRIYEIEYSDQPSQAYGAISSVAGATGAALGGWGAILGPVLGAIGFGWAAIRGKKKLNAETLKSEGYQGVSSFAVGVIEDLKNGEVDTDGDGKVSMAEIGAYAAKKAKGAANPDFVAEVVRVLTSSMEKSEKEKALEAAAAKLTKG